MNPLGNGNASVGLTPQMQQNIQQVKGMMQMMRGNPAAFMQQNPMLAQVLQMCQGQDPQRLFYQMCQQKGINPEMILRELRN